MKLKFFDVETTGLMPGRDVITSLAIASATIDSKTNELIFENQPWHIRFSPDSINVHTKSISPYAFKINDFYSITDKELSSKYYDPYLALKIEEELYKADLVISHNAGFDKSFLMAYFLENKLSEVRIKYWLDTASLYYPKYKKFMSLNELAEVNNLSRKFDTHTALEDVFLLREIFKKEYDIFK